MTEGMAPRSKARGVARKPPTRAQRALGKTLAKQRRALGLSQQDVATRLSVTQGAVAWWEAGKSTPSLDKVRDVAALYAVDPMDLLPARKAA